MNIYSTAFITGALKNRQLKIVGTPSADVSRIVTDSRTASGHSLFVALCGERLNGHDFVEQAFNNGASAALVSQEFAPSDGRVFFVVDDTLLALQDLARAHLKRLPAKRIALSGSNGKTTTKEMISCVLSACLGPQHVIANAGNLNNHIGVPISVFNVTENHQAAIFEMGMNHFGELKTLAEIVKPQVALITNMGSAHSGNVGGPEGVAKAKAELFEALHKDGIAIVNLDDPRCVREAATKAPAKQITFGKSSRAQVRVISAENSGDGMNAHFSFQGQDEHVHLNLMGLHNAVNAAGALAVAMALNLDFKKAATSLAEMAAVKGRLQRHTLPNGALLIDDTYNANPESMEAAFSVLDQFSGRRHLIVLGGMVELGQNAAPMHRMIGASVARHGVAKFFACGEGSQYYGEGAAEAGLDFAHFAWAKDGEELAEIVAKEIDPKDVILVKGSRAMKMEIVVERLLQTPV